MLSGLDKLPPDLKEYVEADNKVFEKEMEEWDILQARKLQQEKLALAAAASVAAQPMSTEPCPPDDTGEPLDLLSCVLRTEVHFWFNI